MSILNPKKGNKVPEPTKEEIAAKERAEADAAAKAAVEAQEESDRQAAEAAAAEAAAAEAQAAEDAAELKRIEEERAQQEAAEKAAAEALNQPKAATLVPPSTKPAPPAPEPGATLVEPERVPAFVRSKSGYSYTDPETKVKIHADRPSKVPYISSWVRSQIKANYIGKTDGNGEFVVENE